MHPNIPEKPNPIIFPQPYTAANLVLSDMFLFPIEAISTFPSSQWREFPNQLKKNTPRLPPQQWIWKYRWRCVNTQYLVYSPYILNKPT